MGRKTDFFLLLVVCLFIQVLVINARPNQHVAEDEKVIEILRRILHLETDANGNADESTDGGTGQESNGHMKDEHGQSEEKEDYGSDQNKKEETDTANLETAQNSSEVHDGGKMIDDFLTKMLSGGEVDPDNKIAYVIESSDSEHDELAESKEKVHDKDEIEKLAHQNAKNKGDEKDKHKIAINDAQTVDRGFENEEEVIKRNFLSRAGISLWPNGVVPYEIKGNLQDPDNQAVIEKAVAEMNDLTCVKFVKRGSPEASSVGHGNYISFVEESGCWSYLGYTEKANQEISLAPGCVTVPTTLHEMCHALGQDHEQSRSDRDGYVSILWNNISPDAGTLANFQKEDTMDNNPFDHESILQYGLKAMSMNDNPTMEFHDRRLDFLADYSSGLTFYDVQDILDAYKCTDHCSNRPQCQNAGVVNHRCQCYCPSGLTGTLCEKTTTDSVCSKDIIDLVDGVPYTILSPKTNGNTYPLNVRCVWFVKAAADRRIKLTINELELSDTIETINGKQARSCYHWLEVQYNLIGQSGPKECGNIAQKTFITSGDGYPNMMMLKFDSAFSADKPAMKGFNLTVETVGIGCNQKPCKFGTCTEDSSGAYQCACDADWTGKNCDIPTVYKTFICTFEEGTSCIMGNVDGDDFDWTVHRYMTSTIGTGPYSAHDGTYYIYMEASDPRQIGDIARLETTYSLAAVDRCLTFWYSMNGGDVGSLSIYTSSSSNSVKQTIWSKTGDQGTEWLTAKVDITADSGQKIGFEAVRGSGWSGDIALDTIELRPGSCAQPLTTKAPTTTTSMPTSPTLHSCTFEPDKSCFLHNVSYDHFDWTLMQGPTSSAETGPDAAYEGSYYNYIETSRTNGQDDIAILESHLLQESTDMCLQFHYHMYGENIGELTLLIEEDGDLPLEEWSEIGNHGNTWNYVEIDLHHHSRKFMILFMAKQGDSSTGDIAIDDVRIIDGLCAPLILPASCTFEPGTDCFLRNFKYDFDWRINKGSTKSYETGPSSAAEGLYYKYIETSSPIRKGDEAWLGSNDLPTGTNMCLRFKYNMNGEAVEEISVQHEVDGFFRRLWYWYYNNGDEWFQIAVDIPSYDRPSRIYFIGVRGMDYRGDIAIDDVHIDQGSCPRHPASGLHCGFSPSEFPCFLDNVDNDDFDWIFTQKSTPSVDTGPSDLYDGFYAYIETSHPRRTGDQAVLSSEHTNVPEGNSCLQFMYNMNGHMIGSLMVHSGEFMHEELRWSMTGDQGDVWTMARVSIPAVRHNQTIKFIGVRGSDYRGDIAIDDVWLTTGLC